MEEGKSSRQKIIAHAVIAVMSSPRAGHYVRGPRRAENKGVCKDTSLRNPLIGDSVVSLYVVQEHIVVTVRAVLCASIVTAIVTNLMVCECFWIPSRRECTQGGALCDDLSLAESFTTSFCCCWHTSRRWSHAVCASMATTIVT